MTNEDYFNYFIENDNIITTNHKVKTTNYILVSLLIITSAFLLFKLINDQREKESINSLD